MDIQATAREILWHDDSSRRRFAIEVICREIRSALDELERGDAAAAGTFMLKLAMEGINNNTGDAADCREIVLKTMMEVVP